MHGDRGAVHMQLADDAAAAFWSADELRAECALVGALAKPQEADQDVPLRVFVGEERLPTPIRGIVAPKEFDGLRADLVMNLMDLWPDRDGVPRHERV